SRAWIIRLIRSPRVSTTGKNAASWRANKASTPSPTSSNLTRTSSSNRPVARICKATHHTSKKDIKKLMPTATAGSLPKPSWLAEPEKLWSPWKLQGEELVDGKQDALRLALFEQQQAGLDIVSDGEQTRQHFVTTFIEHLSGVDFERREVVKIRDR